MLPNKITQDEIVPPDASSRQGRECMTLKMVALARAYVYIQSVYSSEKKLASHGPASAGFSRIASVTHILTII